MLLFIGRLLPQPLLPGSAPFARLPWDKSIILSFQQRESLWPCEMAQISPSCAARGSPVYRGGRSLLQGNACPYTVILSGSLGERNVSSQQLCAAEIHPVQWHYKPGTIFSLLLFALWDQGLELLCLLTWNCCILPLGAVRFASPQPVFPAPRLLQSWAWVKDGLHGLSCSTRVAPALSIRRGVGFLLYLLLKLLSLQIISVCLNTVNVCVLAPCSPKGVTNGFSFCIWAFWFFSLLMQPTK